MISLVFYTHQVTASLVFGCKNHPQFQPFISQIQWLCPDYIYKFLICCLNEHFVSVVTMVSVINPRMICTGVPVTQAWLQSNGSKSCQVLPVILGEDCLVSQDFGNNIWKVKASLQDWAAFHKRVLFLEEEKKKQNPGQKDSTALKGKAMTMDSGQYGRKRNRKLAIAMLEPGVEVLTSTFVWQHRVFHWVLRRLHLKSHQLKSLMHFFLLPYLLWKHK